MNDEELRRQLGQLFIVGFPGHTASEEIKTLIRAPYYVGAIVLFQRNVDTAEQLIDLVHDLQQTAKDAGHTRPLYIGIDQENGLVTRIKPPIAAQLPGSMALGASGSVEDSLRVSKATGELLAFLGINMNYAPVCDVNSAPSNPVIGVRSPGDNGELVGRITSAIAEGLRQNKIVPCVKHFPGHGDTDVDSHYGLPVITKNLAAFNACELVPFRRAVAENIESVMTAHIVVSSLDTSGLPASLNKSAIDLLRNELQYKGLIISDCLEMDAVRAHFGTENGAVMALAAGTDCVMICHTYKVQVGAFEKVLQACKSGELSVDQLLQSAQRAEALKDRFLDWDSALARRSAAALHGINAVHKPIAKEVYSHSTTLVRDDAKALPLSSQDSIIYISPCEKPLPSGVVESGEIKTRVPYTPPEFVDLLKAHNANLVEWPFYEDSTIDEETLSRISQADAVILATRNARLAPSQKQMGLKLANLSKKLITVATCDPYDFIDNPEIKTYITIYEPTPEAFGSAAETIFGALKPNGSLPVLTSRPEIPIEAFDATQDMAQLAPLWHKLLPQYAVPADRLAVLLTSRDGAHFTVRSGDQLVGFIATFAHLQFGAAFIAVLLVDPAHRSRGIGTALVSQARRHLTNVLGPCSITVGSAFPRFWPGVPLDVSGAVSFFAHRGFCPTGGPTARDYCLDLRAYEGPEAILKRGASTGVTFAPWRKDQYEECMDRQRANFGDNKAWVEAYERLARADQYSQALVGVDASGRQVAWTLMLEPGNDILSNFACPQLLGEKTGLVACVGVDKDARMGGVGLALVVNAALHLKKKGIHHVFVDWVSLVGWYEKTGLQVWREYRPMVLKEVA